MEPFYILNPVNWGFAVDPKLKTERVCTIITKHTVHQSVESAH